TAIHQLMWFVSWLGADWVPYLYVSATGLTFHLMGRHRWAVVIWIGVGGSALLNRLLKVAIARQRPNGSLVEILIEYPNESFPSGHVVLFITYFGFLAYLAGRSGLAGPLRSIIVIVSAMLILLVGPSRVYVGAHWPSDILGGYLFGSGWLAVMVLLDRRLRRPSPG
ncbi:MAG TPA: phosphatase PAP2 family protein, partial [Acidobacteriota bacterium]|nr:phosphatase PAP2 family protein [Acidobacteriota bacterium]